jgi:hypothetical protein
MFMRGFWPAIDLNPLERVLPDQTASHRPDPLPVVCFLHRIFPPGFYKDDTDRLVRERLFKPRRDSEEVALTFPLDWEAKERNADRNWRMQLQGWAVFQPIMNFFDGYDDKAAVLDFFFDLAQDWWAVYGDDPDNSVTTRMPRSYAWYDMSVGFRALIIAFFADRIAAFDLDVSPERRAFLETIGRKHIANLRLAETFSLNNHGIFQAQGLMALLRRLPPSAGYESDITTAFDLMERLIDSQFDPAGLHREHSPHYHFYVLATFEAVVASGWYEDSHTITARIDAARDVGKWIVDPLKRPICVGDSILTVQKQVHFPPATGQPYLLSDFDASGYGVLRSDWDVPAARASMVFLQGAYHSTTHKHRDCLSFDWFEQGARVICDGGKYGYKSDKFRSHVLGYKAHNGAEIEDFDILKIKPYGSALKPAQTLADGIYCLQGALEYPAVNHHRLLYINPGKWIVVQDHLKHVRARGTTLWFHLETDFNLQAASGRSFSAAGDKGRTLYVDCLEPTAHMELHRGNEAEMKGFVSSKDYEISPALTAGFSVHGTQHTVTTLLALTPAARSEAMRFAAQTLKDPNAGFTTANLPAPNILPNVPHHIYDDLAQLRLQGGANTYQVTVDGVAISFFMDRKAGKPGKLLAMFPGASARKKSHLDFQRYGWSADFPDHDVIAFSDPSLKPGNTLGLAWFQHHVDSYGIAAAQKLMTALLSTGGYRADHLTLFGSSGGGFTALQLADSLPQARVIAMNPQIFLYNYSPAHYTAMIETCYPGLTTAEVRQKYRGRITVQLDLENRAAPVFIFQNLHDTQHLTRHLRPYLKRLDAELVGETLETLPKAPNKLNVVIFDDPASGHAPPARDKTVAMLAPLLSADHSRA